MTSDGEEVSGGRGLRNAWSAPHTTTYHLTTRRVPTVRTHLDGLAEDISRHEPRVLVYLKNIERRRRDQRPQKPPGKSGLQQEMQRRDGLFIRTKCASVCSEKQGRIPPNDLAVEVLVVVRVVDDDPHSRARAVTGDALPEREGDAQVPVEKEEFLSRASRGFSSTALGFLKKRQHADDRD